jgi:hydroxymethylglutaryl-CoA lyase
MAPARSIDIHINDVGLRDGLQIAKSVMPTAFKKRWIDEAHAAGVPELEVCSFVPPHVVPGMADAVEITQYAMAKPGLMVTVLVPNVKGAQRALDAGANRLIYPLSVSKTHLQANIRKSHAQALDELAEMARLTKAKGAHLHLGLSTAFGCSLEGVVPARDVVTIAEAGLKAGAQTIGLADTIGIANPRQVRDLFRDVFAAVGRDKSVVAHFHDTRGQGLANVVAALDVGVDTFDSCLAGLGGCPFAPGASGNICTEDLVWMLHEMGLKTGIDLEKLIKLRDVLVEGLPDEPRRGHVWKVGLSRTSADKLKVQGRA